MTGTNLSNNGIVHAIDASGKYGPAYVTNDVNLLPESVRLNYANTTAGKTYDSDYLGGV